MSRTPPSMFDFELGSGPVNLMGSPISRCVIHVLQRRFVTRDMFMLSEKALPGLNCFSLCRAV